MALRWYICGGGPKSFQSGAGRFKGLLCSLNNIVRASETHILSTIHKLIRESCHDWHGAIPANRECHYLTWPHFHANMHAHRQRPERNVTKILYKNGVDHMMTSYSIDHRTTSCDDRIGKNLIRKNTYFSVDGIYFQSKWNTNLWISSPFAPPGFNVESFRNFGVPWQARGI